MREFFRGWRRKVGVVTLLMACVFMSGWVRSRAISDNLRFIYANSRIKIWSSSGYLESTHRSQPEALFSSWSHRLEFRRNYFPEIHRPLGIISANDRWECCGFFAGATQIYFLDPMIPALLLNGVAMRYWSIVIPLTLISPWLLLRKPRKSIQKTIDEPIPDEGT